MRGERNEHKRKFKVGDTKITTHIPENDPVFQGVMQAAKILGGNFPGHVGHIIIRSDEVKDSKEEYIIIDGGAKEKIEYFVNGDCARSDSGVSVIRIFAGSIKRVFESCLVKFGATKTTLHEIGHSERNMFEHLGFLIDSKRYGTLEEECAEEFVKHAYNEHHKSKPRLTWRQINESKQNTSTE